MISIVGTKIANFSSVQYALERLGLKYQITSDPVVLQESERVILPGVGHAAAGMRSLNEQGLTDVIRSLKQPVLGICLGMQLMYEFTEEGNVEGLGIFKGSVRELKPNTNDPIPHMGWNEIAWKNSYHPPEELRVGHYYFVHSFAADVTDDTVASCHYTRDFSAIVQKDNFTGIQFHPEKSGPLGEKLLLHFLEL